MPQPHPGSRSAGRFPTTRWSRVLTAGDLAAPEAREALSTLCSADWFPIYAYVRRRGHPPEEARDLTQDFFAYLLERDLIAKADPERGRFRAFLRTVCARQIAAHHDRENAAKRGDGRPPLPIDPLDAECLYTREPADDLTPERVFDRTWAMTFLGRVVDRLRREYDDAGRAAVFEELVAVLTRDPGADPYAAIAGRLGTTEGSVRVAVHRLRRRYGLLLREAIAAAVDDASQVDDEIRALFAALEG